MNTRDPNSQEPYNPKPLVDPQAGEILRGIFEFRQSHCWRILQTLFTAAVAVSIVPYILKPTLITLFGKLLFVFPVVGGLIAVSAVWLYAAEYVRCQPYNEGIRKLLTTAGYICEADIPTLLKKPIGFTTAWVLFIASITLAALNFWAVATAVIPAARQQSFNQVEHPSDSQE